MPGQKKRKRKHQELAQQFAARFAPDAGSWQVQFATQDAGEWKAYLRELGTAEPDLDWSTLRMDEFCGRGDHPDSYRLSRFLPHPEPAPEPHPEPDHEPNPEPDHEPDHEPDRKPADI
ncbi:hypothetical protein ACFYS8_02630 [Kitasatospora sp. NPDC004615]|uniref:hypothetical protein n=1 Tax=Kitasatospora sp. NPDC004615 TaxID=3364017 RepID=UPI00368F2957